MADVVDVTPAPTIPLGRAALCLDCERVFALGGETCPSCAGRAWVLIGRFFMGQGPRTLVRFDDVLHHAGNGLTPARAHAAKLAEVLQELVDLGLVRHEFFHRFLAAHACAVVDAVDATMARLRALGGRREGGTDGRQDQ